jgi:organic radical activating enzyme
MVEIPADLAVIPESFPGKLPAGYVNDVLGWGVPPGLLHSKLEDGTYRLLTLDIDFGQTCSLNCPHCFRKSQLLSTGRPPLTFEELTGVLREAKDLGLVSVKFLGAGEPFEAPGILEMLQLLKEWNIRAAIFTKGYILGSDEFTEIFFGKSHGITKARDLIERLNALDVSILLGFNSFRHEIQDDFIGKRYSIIKNYPELRDRALRWLIEAGFNCFVPGQPTRLALIAAPIKPENIDEIMDIYVWGRRRNMYPLSCPTTYSGLGKAEFEREKKMDFEAYIEALKDLYTKIYLWNMENGVITLGDLKREGVSLYPGCHPCDQVAAGMYVTLEGLVIRCPGRDDISYIEYPDIRKRSSLKDVWMKSKNYGLASQEDKLNYQCLARDGFFFRENHRFYSEIFERILRGERGGEEV